MKRVLLIFLAFVMVLSLVSCSEYKETYEATYSSIRAEQERYSINYSLFGESFEVISSSGDNTVILRDIVTDVLYIFRKMYNAGGLTVMLGADGFPMTYEKYVELMEEVK
jgi:hypothetical protein